MNLDKFLARLGRDLEKWLDSTPSGIMFMNVSREEIYTIHSALIILRREAENLQHIENEEMKQ